MSSRPLKIFCGNATPDLASKVASQLKVDLGKATLKRFSDGETFVRVEENVRGADVFIIQSTCSPANDNLMELILMIDALRRASADRVTAVIPYYGYGRQDRKDAPRTPISARVVADLLESVGIDRMFSLDLHAAQIQGFFKVPVDHLFAAPVILKRMETMISDPENTVLVSPDAGSVERTRAFAKRLKVSIAVADKRRLEANKVAEVNIIGDVKAKEAVIVDDLIDTAGTMCQVAERLKELGATKVWAVATHPVLSGPAVSRLADSSIEKLLVTDTIPLHDGAHKLNQIEVLSVSGLLAEAIARIHNEDSVSALFV